MPVSAHDVAEELRRRLPALPVKKLHKLLYYSQGHHLSTFDEPLFSDTLSAWDMGPVVGSLWHHEKHREKPTVASPLSQAQLNTVGYVVSRYGALTGLDLEKLTHAEEPWRLADRLRAPGGSARIELDWMRTYFRSPGVGGEDDDLDPMDSPSVSRWLADAESRKAEHRREDSPAEIRGRLSRRG